MGKITNENTMSKLINRLEPDAIALSIYSIGKNSGIVDTHVDLVANHFSQTKLLSICKRDIVDVAMSWVWELDKC